METKEQVKKRTTQVAPPWFAPLKSCDQTTTIDNVEMDIKLPIEKFYPIGKNNTLPITVELHCDKTKTVLNNPSTFGYRYRTTFTYDDGENKATFTMFTERWTDHKLKQPSTLCKLSFNPNTCFNNDRCKEAIRTVLSYSLLFHDEKQDKVYNEKFIIRKLDVANDIPIDIDDLMIKNDRRAIITYQYAVGKRSYYIGKRRNKPGRVKIYDKKEQAKLPNDWTCIELTVGNPLADDWLTKLKQWQPTVYCTRSITTDMLIMQNSNNGILKKIAKKAGKYYKEHTCDKLPKLHGTDAVIIALLHLIEELSERAYWFYQLGRSKVEKLLPYFLAKTVKLELNVDVMQQAAMNIMETLYEMTK